MAAYCCKSTLLQRERRVKLAHDTSFLYIRGTAVVSFFYVWDCGELKVYFFTSPPQDKKKDVLMLRAHSISNGWQSHTRWRYLLLFRSLCPWSNQVSSSLAGADDAYVGTAILVSGPKARSKKGYPTTSSTLWLKFTVCDTNKTGSNPDPDPINQCMGLVAFVWYTVCVTNSTSNNWYRVSFTPPKKL